MLVKIADAIDRFLFGETITTTVTTTKPSPSSIRYVKVSNGRSLGVVRNDFAPRTDS